MGSTHQNNTHLNKSKITNISPKPPKKHPPDIQKVQQRFSMDYKNHTQAQNHTQKDTILQWISTQKKNITSSHQNNTHLNKSKITNISKHLTQTTKKTSTRYSKSTTKILNGLQKSYTGTKSHTKRHHFTVDFDTKKNITSTHQNNTHLSKSKITNISPKPPKKHPPDIQKVQQRFSMVCKNHTQAQKDPILQWISTQKKN